MLLGVSQEQICRHEVLRLIVWHCDVLGIVQQHWNVLCLS